jgi:hypothetical protein
MDIAIVLLLGVCAIIIAIILIERESKRWSALRGAGSLNPHKFVPEPTRIVVGPAMTGYNPGIGIVENNSGFSEGLLIGSMLSTQKSVVETVVIEEEAQGPPDPQFSGFQGGDSDGGGASSDWDSQGDTSTDSNDSSSDDDN